MRAKRHLIYYAAGSVWVVGAATTVAVLPYGDPVGWMLLVGGLVGLAVASLIEGALFYSYLKTWDSQLLGEYANGKFGSGTMWGLKRLSFTREDNGDPEFRAHKRALRAVSTVSMVGFVAAAILTLTG